MTVDRTLRTLSALGGASSSRVLNLTAISLAQKDNAGHRSAPFFQSPILNDAIILKHRLRADETGSFSQRRALVTKVIIPFEKIDLNVGGRSFFVGERFFEDMLRDVGNYKNRDTMKRDLDVLRLLDSVPSLDPFLLREHLQRGGFTPDACYFAISNADQQRMFEYSVAEINRLTALAVGESSMRKKGSAGKMVSALLANEISEVLDPLRMTLNLNPVEFSEGIFSWRGFLYYNWSLENLWPQLLTVLRDIKKIRPNGKIDSESAAHMAAVKQALMHGVKTNSSEVRRVLGVYDDAYSNLIDHKDPKKFREFLLSAPSLFVEIGEKIGAMSHVSSFWRYRFPEGTPRVADAEELITLFIDFAQSMGMSMEMLQTQRVAMVA
jgi:hypothetical protein